MYTGFISKLADILEQERAIYQDILKMSKEKTNVIIEGRVSDLERIVSSEQSLIVQLGKLEELRENLISEISSYLNIPPQDLKISDIIVHVDEEQAERLRICKKGIEGTLNELMNVNDLNSKLIKNSLEYIDFSINILSRLDTGINSYGSTGHVNPSGKRNFLDIKL
ncbi:MAG TPA: flagellar protein FlgN [Clostridiaceae bacterium]|nr:flagellar protein FlgN [Clostridiaceae bacterium]